MNIINTKNIVLAAIMSALIFAVTNLIRIPLSFASGGYLNLGDAPVYLTALFLPPPFAFAAGALGSGLSDLLAGYPQYALATFIIKGIMAFVSAVIYRKYGKFSTGAVLAGFIMPIGYFCFETILMGVSGAIANLPYNAVQLAGGVAAALLLYPFIVKAAHRLNSGANTL